MAVLSGFAALAVAANSKTADTNAIDLMLACMGLRGRADKLLGVRILVVVRSDFHGFPDLGPDDDCRARTVTRI